MEHIWQILEEVKDTRKKMREAIKAGDFNLRLFASWIDHSLKLEEALAKKLDEYIERLVLLEDELRGKKATKKKKAKTKKKKKGWF